MAKLIDHPDDAPMFGKSYDFYCRLFDIMNPIHNTTNPDPATLLYKDTLFTTTIKQIPIKNTTSTHRIYADCNAETFECEESLKLKTILTSSSCRLGNPSSLHLEGKTAKSILDTARNVFEIECGAIPDSLIFTSGATESNHLAIVAGMNSMTGKSRIVTTPFEHASVSRIVKEYDPLYVKIGRSGDVDLKSLEDLCLEPDVGMASIILAHNEIGIVQSTIKIRDVMQRVRRNKEPDHMAITKNPVPLLHYDATQVLGKMLFKMIETESDLVSWSGHKFRGPGGVGGLFVSSRTSLTPYPICCPASGDIGGQEKGLRAGTENVCGAACATIALIAENERGYIGKSWDEMRIYADAIVRRVMCGCHSSHSPISIDINAAPSFVKPQTCDRLCNTIHISYINVTGGTTSGVSIAKWLDSQRGISVSTGSACSKSHPSVALNAIGLDEQHIKGAIRISLCPGITTEKDAETITNALLDARDHVVD